LIFLVVKPAGKRLLVRPRHRWEDNIEADLKEMEFESVDWINLAQDRDKCQAVVTPVIKLRSP
jgi:hypothetical protein